MKSESGEELPTSLSEVPRWAESFVLHQIALTGAGDGAVLPSEAVHHLGQMLALSASGEPHAGIEIVEELCDSVSSREYAWALFENWRLAGYPDEFGWVLTALRWFGDDEGVRRLVAESEDRCFHGVWISRDGQADGGPIPGWSDPLGTLDPVTASEILRDLTEVTAQ